MTDQGIKLDVLAFSAHPDDIELAAAGTIIKLNKQGYAVGVADMTRGEFGTRGTMEIRQKEAEEAGKLMNLKVRECLDIPDGGVTVTRENHLKVIRLLRKYRPRIVINHYWKARHADHMATSNIVTEACYLSGLAKIGTGQERWRPKRILYHQLLYDVIPSFVVDISQEAEQKWKVVRAHKSQFFDPESKEPETILSAPAFLEMINTKMRYWGELIGATHAEAFLTTEPFAIPDIVQALG
ncbi:bacillithiol biosynthesis deacetylase BshB1 [bacterium]|nr:bacillithiol biosynthesis deacetylase BshB1 [bacterium]MCI0618727.1 bacillithiol biosynthesis deacetylase BshB1 [bacterium]